MGSGLFDTAFRSLREIKNGLPNAVKNILKETEDEIIKLNTERQLFLGLNNKGQKIKPSYKNKRYSKSKNLKNPLSGYGNPDLSLSGKKDTPNSFYSEFLVIFEDNGEFNLLSSKTTKKGFDLAGHLESNYDNIYGLTPDHEGFYNFEILLPKLQTWAISKLKI